MSYENQNASPAKKPDVDQYGITQPNLERRYSRAYIAMAKWGGRITAISGAIGLAGSVYESNATGRPLWQTAAPAVVVALSGLKAMGEGRQMEASNAALDQAISESPVGNVPSQAPEAQFDQLPVTPGSTQEAYAPQIQEGEVPLGNEAESQQIAPQPPVEQPYQPRHGA